MLQQGMPLVSCICLTHNSVEKLNRAVGCFQNQTYPNKELVVAVTDDNTSTNLFLNGLNDSRIKLLTFPASTRLSLGQKRNLAIENCKGFYFCVWDDDDWYSNTRIAFHVKSLAGTGYKSSVLSSLILYDAETNEAYLSATRWAWEQTLLCEKSVFENSTICYANLERGEDSVLVYNLKKNDLLFTAYNPASYIYVYHGKNTSPRAQWEQNLLQWATKLSKEQSIITQKILDGKLRHGEATDVLEEFFIAKKF